MTLVVAEVGESGAYVISDFQVTANGAVVPALGVQKILRITKNAVVAIAGSVRVGLDMAAAIRETLTYPGPPLAAQAFMWVHAFQSAYSRSYYSDAYPEDDRSDGLELVLVSYDSGPFAAIYRFPRPDEPDQVEYRQYTEPITLMIGAPAGLEVIENIVSAFQPMAHQPIQGQQTSQTENALLRVAYRNQNYLQYRVRELQADFGLDALVGSTFGTAIVDKSGVGWLPTTDSPPLLVRDWHLVTVALQAMSEGIELRSNDELLAYESGSRF